MSELIVAQDKEQELTKRVDGALIEAQAFKIENNEDYVEAGRRRDNLKALDTFVSELVDGPTKAAHAVWKLLVSKRDRFQLPIENARKAYKLSMFSFQDAQDKKRMAEEARLAAIARKTAEDAILAQAQAAEASGQAEQAQAILEAPIVVPVIVLSKETPKIAGLTRRTVWKYRITNVSLIPKEYLMVDETKLGKVVRALGSAANIPGVLAYSEDC